MTLNERLAAINLCYLRSLRGDPTLAGRITIQFTIGEGGRVSNAAATEDTTGSPQLAHCVASTFRRIVFPAPEGGSVTVSLPFLFEPD